MSERWIARRRLMYPIAIAALCPVVLHGDNAHNALLAFGGMAAQIALFVVYKLTKESK